MSFRWRRWSRVLPVIILLGLTCGVVIRRPILRTLGSTLVVDEPIEAVDAIVAPQWAGAAGVIDAADLVHSGIARRVAILPGPPSPAERELTRRGIPYQDEATDLVQLLRSLGVADIEVIPDPASGTETEGQVLLSWCE